MSGIGARRAWAKARKDGFAAHWPGICARCHDDITPGQRIAPVRGGFAHIGCVNGASDE